MNSLKTQLFLILLFFKSLYSFGQVCQEYTYLCSSLNTNSFIKYDNSATIPAVVNGNTCARGSFNGNFCSPINFENQSWFVLKVIDPISNTLPINFSINNNQNLSISFFGPFSSTSFDACDYIDNGQNSCRQHENNSSIPLTNTYAESYYFMVVVNESNLPGNINLNCTEANVEFYHFVPQPPPSNCIKPTAKVVTENIIVRKEEAAPTQVSIEFTGTPPFYYKLKDGNYEFVANSNNHTYPGIIFTRESTEFIVGSVRNSCGNGTVFPTSFSYLTYDKDTALVMCLPFENNFKDYRSDNIAYKTSGIFNNSFNNQNSLVLNGIDENVKFKARDLISENFTISLWVHPNGNFSGTQTIFSLGTEKNNSQILSIISNSNKYFNFEYTARNGSKHYVQIPANSSNWTHLTIIKNNNTLIIKDHFGSVNSTDLIEGEVPRYGNKSILTFGSEPDETNFYKGGLKSFKFFSGILPLNILNSLFNSTECELKLCDSIPIIEQPGFINVLPGTTSTTSELKFKTLKGDVLRLQGLGEIPSVFSSSYNSYIPLTLRSRDNFEYKKYISGKCGTAKFKDTLKIISSPVLVNCFTFNNGTSDYFNAFLYNLNVNNFTTDRSNNPNSALKFESNSYLSFWRPDIDQRNYSIAFWMKPSNQLEIEKSYSVYEFDFYDKDKLLIKKKSNNTFLLTFQKYNSNNSFLLNLPNISEKWTHFAIVYQSGNSSNKGNLRIYIDSKEVLNIIVNNIDNFSNNSRFIIGNVASSGLFESIKGDLDDFKIFKGGLSRIEINNIYTQNLECLSKICDQEPELSKVDSSYIPIKYGSNFLVNLKLLKDGPISLKYSINDFQNISDLNSKKEFYLPSIYNSEFNYTMVSTGENNIKIKKLINHCKIKEDEILYKFIIQPDLKTCLNFDNEEFNLDSDIQIDTLNLKRSQNNHEDNAIAFNQNSKFNLFYTGLKVKDFTSSFRFKITENSNPNMTILQIGTNQNFYKIKLTKDNLKYILTAERQGVNLSSNNFKSLSTLANINENEWYHCSVLFESKSLKIFINGVEISNINDSKDNAKHVFLDLETSIRFTLGSNLSNSEKFIGSFDDFKFFKGGLNKFEVKKIFNKSTCDFNYCPENVSLSKEFIESKSIFGGKTVISTSKINSKISFLSEGSILLNPGFEIKNNNVFRAEIAQCDNDNP